MKNASSRINEAFSHAPVLPLSECSRYVLFIFWLLSKFYDEHRTLTLVKWTLATRRTAACMSPGRYLPLPFLLTNYKRNCIVQFLFFRSQIRCRIDYLPSFN